MNTINDTIILESINSIHQTCKILIVDMTKFNNEFKQEKHTLNKFLFEKKFITSS